MTSTEIQNIQLLVKSYNAPEISEIESAIATLEKNNGDLETSFNELWDERVGSLGTYSPGDKSLWQVTLKELRKEVCGDEGFRGKVKEYSKNPGSAPLLTGVIVSLVGIAGAHGLPLDPAIATIIVLYILKIGLNIFCEYTEPPKTDNPS
ncbi:MAG: hypothetical protein HC866_20400 [Leptolyngbyaceae cyanobacterium RU_5_1]|nr:hypothetical protein [Leptolyngbyaceae cyanobacterium RU_5_1]